MLANPVPRGLSTRREGGPKKSRSVPLVRVPRTLPKVLAPVEVDKLVTALRTDRDRAMVTAIVLVGLRRCEVLGLRLGDIWAGERKVFVAEGKGGHQRVVPASGRFFAALGDYLHNERPKGLVSDKVFVVLKGPRRGQPLSADGLDEVLGTARARAGLDHATCHELRHTWLTSCGKRAWRWRPCRPRRATARSSRPGSTCTSPTTGGPSNTEGRRP